MNYWHILTLIFVTFKLLGATALADWSWWLILSPSLISLGVCIFFMLLATIIVAFSSKR